MPYGNYGNMSIDHYLILGGRVEFDEDYIILKSHSIAVARLDNPPQLGHRVSYQLLPLLQGRCSPKYGEPPLPRRAINSAEVGGR